jgi:multiple sugar transport system substrate-binding protein
MSMDHPGSSRVRSRIAMATIAVVAIAGVPGSVSAQSPAAQPYAGTNLTVETYANDPEFDFYGTLMQDFKDKTGIIVNYIQQPIDVQDTKIPAQLKAKDDSLDVFFTGSENIGQYVGVSGVEPLDQYINNPALTPASWDFADIPSAVEYACQQNGVTYCIAPHENVGILYYNTKMFADAGITAPPQTPDELLAMAKQLTTADHAGFCVRADKSQTLYDAFQLWQWFFPWDNPVTGNYFDKDWNFILGTEPQASAFATWYRDLLQNAAPEGIATYLADNCLQDFQQGRVAMWHDASAFIPAVLDPEQSTVSDSVSFWSLPCPPVNPDHCALVQPFGTWINSASKNKEAAWMLVQYLTSKETQLKAAQAKALVTPSRTSVVTDPSVVAAMPNTFAAALANVLGHANVALLPFIPEGVSIIPPIANGLSELTTGSGPVADVMASMKAGVDKIMKEAGYPKAAPGS